MPEKLFDTIPEATVRKVIGRLAMTEVHDSILKLPEPSRSMILWLLDLMVNLL